MNKDLALKDYYLGLDCGTESVGWAVTDTDYNLLKFNGKSMWGSHLFDEAKTAKERRGARCARRRLQRRNQRIALLQEIFAEEIFKIDPTFFIRLNDSQYLVNDKHNPSKNIIFNDSGFTDKDFFKKYPTIYHLRYALTKEEITDPRLLYLGIAHILKHRGHFLFPGERMSDVTTLDPVIDEIKKTFFEIFNCELGFSSKSELEAALKEKKSSEKGDKLLSVLELCDSNLKKLIKNCLVGYKVKPQQLFGNDEYFDLCAIEFKKSSFEETDLPELEEVLSDDEYKFILLLKSLFDWSLLEEVRNGKIYISEAKIDLFNKNKKDLKVLKEAIKQYVPDKYVHFFHEEDTGSFSCYIGKNHDNHKSKEFRPKKRCKVDEFYKTVKGLLSSASESDEKLQYILESIENESFLPLLRSYKNGVIPYQLNKLELDAILQNARQYFSFLSKKDEQNISNEEKIKSILTYRIPYYVGPLNKQNSSGNAWAIRKESGRILPWNIENKVDFGKSAEQFILRMTNKCTYCKEEDVLPKQSLSYSKYMVLNELNSVKINGCRLSVERKQEIYNELFKKKKKVTLKALIDYSIKQGWYEKTEISKDGISGIDGDFKSSLSSYFDFKEFIKPGKLKADDVDLIIKWITIFSEGGDILKERIRDSYSSVLNKEEIDRISKLKYSGWGRFSHKFLYEIYTESPETGELFSITKMLWTTQNNLMELLSNKYEFKNQIDSVEPIENLNYSIVDDLYVSPAVKRQIWQTLKVVNEIKSVMKHCPKKVFIEVTRSEQEKKRTTSRKNDLIAKLKDAQKSGLGFDIETQNLINSLNGADESQISRQDKLYLYYSQCGKCMYTGKAIEIEDLYNINLYDVDHIYPYSRSNDDSLTNRVLVCKTANTRKSNDYPIEDSVKRQMIPFWNMLVDKGFISTEKYNRLIRSTPLSDDDIKGFIARQLVETSQSVKASASILKAFFSEETKIVYSKAKNVSDFRNREGHEFYKCRSLNNLHHAKDAYLNIVVGNVFDTKYSNDFYKYANGIAYGNMSKIYDYDVRGAWKTGEEGTIQTITRIMKKNDVLYTVQPVARKGQLFDLQIVKKGAKKGALPTKSSNGVLSRKLSECTDQVAVFDEWTSKYGGYNSLTTSYFALVKHTEKTKTIVSFIPISIIDSEKLKTDAALIQYCEKVLSFNNTKVIRNKVLMNTKFRIDGYKFILTGKSSGGKQITLNSCIPLILTRESTATLKHVESFLNKKANYKDVVVNPKHDKLSDEDFSQLYKELVTKSNSLIYAKRPSSQNDLISSSFTYEKFMSLNAVEKCVAVAELMKYFGMGNGLADFSLIGGTKACGTILKGANFDLDKTDLSIIDSSPTGLFEMETKIEP